MNILVTGGTGYIGSHTCVALLEAGHDVVIVDNLSNSEETTVDKIQELSGKQVKFYNCDVCDRSVLAHVFSLENIDAVIHFAGLKAVGESVQNPLYYYSNNLISTLNLLDVMKENNVRKLVFSSSATVYGKPESIPIPEDASVSATNPYGHTKLMQEQIVKDLYASDNNWKFVLLRYFNPIGAHERGVIGELPKGIPNNLMPYITQVANGKLEKLRVFGDDYPTLDGTGIRDYIHVMDLAQGHVAALERAGGGLSIYNLGTGQGTSVLELIKTFEQVNELKILYEIVARRDGDVAEVYADTSKAERELGFKAKRNLTDMCRDSWQFEKNTIKT